MANKDKARYHRKFTDMEARNREARNCRDALRKTARETAAATGHVQRILRGRTDLGWSRKYSGQDIIRRWRLGPPAFAGHGTTIQVRNMDTLDAAVELRRQAMQQPDPRRPRNLRPAVLNFANADKPGGGWRNGAVAQEEAMCYRSTLARSLHQRDYPLRPDQGIYSSRVAVLRHSMRSGHAWITDRDSLSPATVRQLPWYSALTIAAIYKPGTRSAMRGTPPRQTKVFARNADRRLTKAKMRLALHMAAMHGHDMLVLGAFGCGVFENPPWDVAQCWLEVLREYQHRWRCVWFAVYDPRQQGNFRTFEKLLNGKTV